MSAPGARRGQSRGTACESSRMSTASPNACQRLAQPGFGRADASPSQARPLARPRSALLGAPARGCRSAPASIRNGSSSWSANTGRRPTAAWGSTSSATSQRCGIRPTATCTPSPRPTTNCGTSRANSRSPSSRPTPRPRCWASPSGAGRTTSAAPPTTSRTGARRARPTARPTAAPAGQLVPPADGGV
jgi:hypothetical protein